VRYKAAMQPRITHIALHVRDLEACVAFYARFCNMHVVHERPGKGGQRIVWIAEPGRERDFILVLLPGGPGYQRQPGDASHLGFAMRTKDDVDAIAAQGRAAGCLILEPKQDEYPAGYYCGLEDPEGHIVEFSYGQPLGPGAEDADAATLGSGGGD
jgi:catechol 2,3-dioxygenase-like lactoylglutathione lyase family enzyme